MTRMLSIAGMAALAAAAFSTNANADANNPTFYKDVLPIMQENCQVCHRANGANYGGMVAPMAFTSYEEVRPWAKGILKQVESRAMPPWSASAEQHGDFRNERTLTETEIATIVNWVNQGAKRGNPKDAPPSKNFNVSETGWLIGEPDIVLDMGVDFFVEDNVQDLYVDFDTVISDELLPEDRWVQAVEFKAGSSAVHHIIARPLGGMAPGYDPIIYQEGYGHRIEKGATVRWNMHYHKEPGEGTGVMDRSQAALKFWPKGTVIDHPVHTESLGAFDFRIPAGDPNYKHQASYTFPEDVLIYSMNPHMHVRGKSAKYTAIYPDGSEEVILDVPRYDFNWQITYTYAEPKKLPAGTTVRLDAAWDNSANNPSNPDPTKTIRWGRPTTDEMMFGWVKYTNVEPLGLVAENGPDSTD